MSRAIIDVKIGIAAILIDHLLHECFHGPRLVVNKMDFFESTCAALFQKFVGSSYQASRGYGVGDFVDSRPKSRYDDSSSILGPVEHVKARVPQISTLFCPLADRFAAGSISRLRPFWYYDVKHLVTQ